MHHRPKKHKFWLSLLYVIGLLCLSPSSWAASTIHEAAEKGNLDEITSFIHQGTRVDAPDANLATPLMLACRAGHRDVVTYLLDAGASVYIQDMNGDSPLHYAARAPNAGPVQLLLNRRVDPHAKNHKQETALDIARAAANQEVLYVFEYLPSAKGGNKRDPLKEAEEVLSDPNAIHSALKQHPELTQAFQVLETSFRQERASWMSRRFAQRSRLTRAVLKQVTAEFDLVIKTAKDENGTEVYKFATKKQKLWHKYYSVASDRLNEEYRSQSDSGNESVSGRPSRRRRSAQRREAGRDEHQEMSEEELQRLNEENEVMKHMSPWMQTSNDNREYLCKKVITDYFTDMLDIRRMAKQRDLAKTVVAVEGLMLARSARMDGIVERIENRKMREVERNTRNDMDTMGRSRRSRRK